MSDFDAMFDSSPAFRVLLGQVMDVNAMAREMLSEDDYATFQRTTGARARAYRTLMEIDSLALAEGNLDLLWASAYLRGRGDFADGSRWEDDELGALPTAMNIREGLRELERRGLVLIRVERPGRPHETWSVFASKGSEE